MRRYLRYLLYAVLTILMTYVLNRWGEYFYFRVAIFILSSLGFQIFLLGKHFDVNWIEKVCIALLFWFAGLYIGFFMLAEFGFTEKGYRADVIAIVSFVLTVILLYEIYRLIRKKEMKTGK